MGVVSIATTAQRYKFIRKTTKKVSLRSEFIRVVATVAICRMPVP